MSPSIQTDSVLSPAHVCVNCQHGQSLAIAILQGRFQGLLREDAKILLSSEGKFFTVEMVRALENIARAYQWKCRCTKQKVQVRLFERACYSWEPAATQEMNGTMQCAKIEEEQQPIKNI